MMLNWLNRSISANSSCRRRLPVLLSSASSWRPSSSQRKKTTSPSLQLLNYHHSSSSSLHRSSNSSNFAAAQPPNVSCCYSKRSSFGSAAVFSTKCGDSSGGGGGDGAPLRRRRKPARSSSSNNNNDNDNTTHNSITGPTPHSSSSSSSTTTGGGEAFFSPINSTTGHLLTSDEYLQLASLSPWVPCPDVVAKRVFEIASASNEDVHVDLGCGDGRLNFMAVDNTATSSSASGGGGGVKKSWGVDVDENILKKCHERLGRRFVPRKTTPTTRSDYNGDDNDDDNEEERLGFIQADLIKVVEKQKELYQRDYQQRQQQQQLGRNDDTTATVTTTSYKNAINNDNDSHANINNNNIDEFLQSITDKISNSTIITMYFVDNALQQLQPYLASILGGKKNVRVITIGYEMPNTHGWNASWVELVLGLTIFRYDMENVSRFPTEWNLDNENDDNDDNKEGSGGNTRMQRLEDDNTIIGDDQDVEEFLRRKRQEDIEELNRGLRIHHDEELDDFAHARAKRLGGGMNHTANHLQSTLVLDDDDDDETWDGDFDETEEPEELMKEAQRKMIEARKASRGKMMAGVGGGEGKKKKASVEATSKKPTWKKP